MIGGKKGFKKSPSANIIILDQNFWIVNFNNPKILIQNNNVRARRFLESFFTSYHPSAIKVNVNFNNPKILIQNNNVRARRFLESFFTSYHPSAINRSTEFSEIYVPTIKKCID